MAEIKNKKRKNAVEESGIQMKRRKQSGSGLVTVSSTNPKDDRNLSECFHKVTTHLYVSLAPVHTHEPLKGIKQQHLDPLLMSYFPPAEGVVLAHYNLKLCGQDEKSSQDEDRPVMARIMYDSPFAYMWISVDLLVWKPMPGDVLEGWINLQSPSHIGLLVHDTFNVTIKRDAIPKGWVFIPNQADDDNVGEDADEEDNTNDKGSSNQSGPRSLGHWIDETGSRIDGKLRFTVKSLNVSARIVSVQGSLLKPGEVREDLTKLNTHNTNQDTATQKKHVKFENDDDDESSSESVGEKTDNNSAANDDDGKVEYGESDSDANDSD
jgi:DNA-directed RNA polymerase I subunit RPA43